MRRSLHVVSLFACLALVSQPAHALGEGVFVHLGAVDGAPAATALLGVLATESGQVVDVRTDGLPAELTGYRLGIVLRPQSDLAAHAAALSAWLESGGRLVLVADDPDAPGAAVAGGHVAGLLAALGSAVAVGSKVVGAGCGTIITELGRSQPVASVSSIAHGGAVALIAGAGASVLFWGDAEGAALGTSQRMSPTGVSAYGGDLIVVGDGAVFTDECVESVVTNAPFWRALYRSDTCDADGDGHDSSHPACGGDDCDDLNGAVYAGHAEVADCRDNDCDGDVDEGIDTDTDNDGYSRCIDDCNDLDPTSHPGAIEKDDCQDNDCDGEVDEGFDVDGDGYTPVCGGDCDEADPYVHPDQPELCDGKDTNCNGGKGSGEADDDHDGYLRCCANCAPTAGCCDCNDWDTFIHPGMEESCNDIDDDCNGETDERARTTTELGAAVEGPTDVLHHANVYVFTETVQLGEVRVAYAPGDEGALAVTCRVLRSSAGPDGPYAQVAAASWTHHSAGPEMQWFAVSFDPPTLYASLHYWIGCAPSVAVQAFRSDAPPTASFATYLGQDTEPASIPGSVTPALDAAEPAWRLELQVLDNDVDGDGQSVLCGDCDDSDPTVFTGAEDPPGDCIDQNCNGIEDCDQDCDGDPAMACGGSDCADLDPARSSEAVEMCNAVDDDCDSETDEGFDGLGEFCVVAVEGCQYTGEGVCSDDGESVACAPLVEDPFQEVCNGKDDDCDGLTDEGDLCEDGNLCTVGEACVDGHCTAGVAVSCNDDNLCTADVCDPSEGCTHAAVSGCCNTVADCPAPAPCGAPSCVDHACVEVPSCLELEVCAFGECHPPCNPPKEATKCSDTLETLYECLTDEATGISAWIPLECGAPERCGLNVSLQRHSCCEPDCTDKECGRPSECLLSCGECDEGEACVGPHEAFELSADHLAAFRCVPGCDAADHAASTTWQLAIPECGPSLAGTDGVTACGACEGHASCIDGRCRSACEDAGVTDEGRCSGQTAEWCAAGVPGTANCLLEGSYCCAADDPLNSAGRAACCACGSECEDRGWECGTGSCGQACGLVGTDDGCADGYDCQARVCVCTVPSLCGEDVTGDTGSGAEVPAAEVTAGAEIEVSASSQSSDDGGCSTSNTAHPRGMGVAWLLLFGVAVVWCRRVAG